MRGVSKLLLLLMLYSLRCSNGMAQQNTIGLPTIINYPKQLYKAGRQNWGIAQDKNGLLYFANSDGLLTFDGVFWQLYPLPNKTVVRSIEIANDGKVYVGGQGEIGYFSPDEKGSLQYYSLNRLLPAAENNFTDVWNIVRFGEQLFFRTNKRILQYTGSTIVVHKSENWTYLGSSGVHLYAVEASKGLLYFSKGTWQSAVKSGNLPTQSTVRASVLIGQDSLLLPTLSHGIFLLHKDTIRSFRSKDIDHIARQHIYQAKLLSTGKLALVTNLAGCFIVDTKGKYIQQYSKTEGIQNNHVLSILQDKDENIWLGLDNGIDLISYNNAIKNIFPEKEDRNSAYTAAIYNNKLYIGLSTGLYSVGLNNEKDISFTLGSFERVPSTKGQVWNLTVIQNRLLMGHTNGAFLIRENSAVPIDTKTGFWNFQTEPGSNAPAVVAGNYNGIAIFPNGVNQENEMLVPFESARFVEWHNGVVWVAHPYKGLYKIHYNPGKSVYVEQYEDKQKILSENYNKLYRLGEELILTTGNGIFSYSNEMQDFTRSTWLEQLFGTRGVSYLKADKYANIWFCRNRKVGVVDRSGTKPRLIYFPELDDKILAAGFNFIHIEDSSNVLIAGEKGFFHLNYALYKKNKYPVKAFIRQVRSSQEGHDGILFGGFAQAKAAPSIKYNHNGLRVECSAVLYGQEDNTEYSYFLAGFDKDWTVWSKRTEKEYTNLPPGNYTFNVKVRNNYDNESAATSYSFTILPPWYQTWWAITIWCVLIFGVLYFFYKRQQQKYRRQQSLRLAEQRIRHQLEVEKNEREIVRLRNEKLEAEMEHKNQELASSAMNLVRKIETLTHLKSNLLQFQPQIESEKAQKEFLKMVKTLDKELDFKEEWDRFTVHFDTVHANFLQKLKQYCPSLTSSELKLAAYLRLNLSSKEIAQLMNISIRGVETGRYRLRKKLGIGTETNLTTFLSSVG